MKHILLPIAAFLLVCPVTAQTYSGMPAEKYDIVKVSRPRGKKVKNIILMIGDGMGLEQIGCAWVVNDGKLNLDNFPVIGLQRTYSADKLITDSAGAGTALASGNKTNNGYIACDTLGNPLSTLITAAKEKGKRTGVSVVCRLNDATPAVFCSHINDRDEAEKIIAQYPDCGIDYITGGGSKYWNERTDGVNVISQMEEKGYSYVSTKDELSKADALPILGLFAPLEMPPAQERGDLFTFTAQKALELLDGPKGFFLMLEGSCIDDYGHENNVEKLMGEILDFDRTVGEVLKWAAEDGQTLVIVTADHSTGGLTLLDGNKKEGSITVNFSTDSHNGILIPVFAFGPGSEHFGGVYENSQLSNKIRALIK